MSSIILFTASFEQEQQALQDVLMVITKAQVEIVKRL
jgi:hypothetical protein